MKVLLLNPPYTNNYIRSGRWCAQSISGSNWYPIWLAYCTGLLEKNGHICKLVDASVDKLSTNDILVIAEKFSPDVIFVYISSDSLKSDISVCKKLKSVIDSEIFLVGPWCSGYSNQILLKSEGVDGVIRGEFDFAALDLANSIPKEEIKGLSWKGDGQIIKNPDRESIREEDIMTFPFVTDVYKHHLNIKNYYQAPHLHPFVDMFTGRGCAWGRCTFCLWPNTINKGGSYRVRKISNVIEELSFIHEELPFVKEIFIQDDVLPDWRAKELSVAIMESGLDITWSCYSRVDISYETLKLMKKSGCRALHVGYESSDIQILKNIRKGTTPNMCEKFTENANKAGLQIHADFIFGLPGETESTIKSTIKWAKKLNVSSYQFSVAKPYSNTPFYKWLEKNSYLKDGQVSYPELSHEELCNWVKIAMRECYINFRYIQRMSMKSKEFWRVVRSALHVLPSIFRN